MRTRNQQAKVVKSGQVDLMSSCQSLEIVYLYNVAWMSVVHCHMDRLQVGELQVWETFLCPALVCQTCRLKVPAWGVHHPNRVDHGASLGFQLVTMLFVKKGHHSV